MILRMWGHSFHWENASYGDTTQKTSADLVRARFITAREFLRSLRLCADRMTGEKSCSGSPAWKNERHRALAHPNFIGWSAADRNLTDPSVQASLSAAMPSDAASAANVGHVFTSACDG
jgi:hypothetical protein